MTTAFRSRTVSATATRRRGGLAAFAVAVGIVLAPLYLLRAASASAEDPPPGALSTPSALEATTSTTAAQPDACPPSQTRFLDLGGDGQLHELQIERDPDDECGSGDVGACEADGASQDGDYPACCPSATAGSASKACVRFPVPSRCMGDDTDAPDKPSCTIYTRTARNCEEADFALAGCTTLANNLFDSCRTALESGQPRGICRQVRLPLFRACAVGQVTGCDGFVKNVCNAEPGLAGCTAPPQPQPPIRQPVVPDPPTPIVPPTTPNTLAENREPQPTPRNLNPEGEPEVTIPPASTTTTEAESNPTTESTESTETTQPTESTESGGSTPEPDPAPSPAGQVFPEAQLGGTEPGSLKAIVDRWLTPEFSFDAPPTELAGRLASDVASGRATGLLLIPLVAGAGTVLALCVDRVRRSNGY